MNALCLFMGGRQTFTLAEEAQWFRAGADFFLSFILCLAGVRLGNTPALCLNEMKGH
jgi:hypothetical protein